MKRSARSLMMVFGLVALAGGCGDPDGDRNQQQRACLTDGTVVLTGTCQGLTGHDCSGTVNLYRRDDGSYQLRFEGDFDVTDIPGGFVYLTRQDTPNVTAPDLDDPNSIDIGRLVGFRGCQQYNAPSSFAPTQTAGEYNLMYIWCRPFSVEVAGAQLRAPTSVPAQ